MKKTLLILLSILLNTGFSFAQTPSSDPALLLPSTFFTSKGLTLNQSNQNMNQYINKAYTNASLEMVYDIRLVFSSAEHANTYIDQNLEKVSEGGYPYKKAVKIPNASAIYMYREAPSVAKFNNAMGVPHAQWYIIFVIDRVVVKIFTSGYFTPFSEPYEIAVEAAKHVSDVLIKPVTIQKYEVQDAVLLPEFLTKTKEANVKFNLLPGYENHELPQNLTTYFDQEFVYPHENMAMRVYVIPPGESAGTKSYEEFCRLKAGASSSVYLNIFMPDLKKDKFPAIKETKDSLECKKQFNGDFKVEAISEVSKNSILAKGYKYAYCIAFYKRGYGDCYVVYLANDERKFALFPQLTGKVFQY